MVLNYVISVSTVLGQSSHSTSQLLRYNDELVNQPVVTFIIYWLGGVVVRASGL